MKRKSIVIFLAFIAATLTHQGAACAQDTKDDNWGQMPTASSAWTHITAGSTTGYELKDGYYYVSENESFTVKIRPTWNLRFINLPQGTEYQISETLVDPFNFYSADCSPDDDADFQINGETTVGTGKIGAEDKSYLVTYKNTCRTFDTEVLKRNADNTATASNAHFALYTKEEYEKTPKGDPIFADITDENGNGIIQLGSLAIGEYKLVETKAPN